MRKRTPVIGTQELKEVLQDSSTNRCIQRLIERVPPFHRTKAGQEFWAERIREVLESIEASDIDSYYSKVHEREMTTISLYYGRKLLVVFYESNGSLTTRVDTESERGERERETTVIYGAARILMQIIADKTRESLKYEFTTHRYVMKRWAEIRGKQIFKWRKKTEDEEDEDGVCVSHKATIRPK